MSGRFALLPGARNFRAVKPYLLADGRRLKADTLFRSGELSQLSDADIAAIAAFDIRMVCDLRSAREQAEFVSRWPAADAPGRLDLPGREESDAGPHRIFEMITASPCAAGAMAAMDMLYRRKPQAFAESLRILLARILAGGNLPLLIHCHAGKDRTGFIIAMLLSAAGVADEDIIDDYLTTAQYFPVEVEAPGLAEWARLSFGRVIELEAAKPMVEARREYIEAALHEINQGWGSTGNYLREAAGLSDVRRGQLQDLLAQ